MNRHQRGGPVYDGVNPARTAPGPAPSFSRDAGLEVRGGLARRPRRFTADRSPFQSGGPSATHQPRATCCWCRGAAASTRSRMTAFSKRCPARRDRALPDVGLHRVAILGRGFLSGSRAACHWPRRNDSSLGAIVDEGRRRAQTGNILSAAGHGRPAIS